jgi:hypothetical protein
MADRATSESNDDGPSRATETGTIFWISIGLGTVASLPLLSGMADGSVTVARGAMWFLITTLVAMCGVWAIAWLMHVFSDPYPDDVDDDGSDGAHEPAISRPSFSADQAPTFDDDRADASSVPAPAMSETP